MNVLAVAEHHDGGEPIMHLRINALHPRARRAARPHTNPLRGIAPVLLEHDDVVVWSAALDQAGEIQSTWTAANSCYLHVGAPSACIPARAVASALTFAAIISLRRGLDTLPD